MKILAIDTSGNPASAAVTEDNVLLGEYILNHKKTHSQKIMVMLERLLSDLEMTVDDIDVFAASVGPGSFTGIRIGVATIKALAHSVNKPVVSVNTLEGLAYNVSGCGGVIVPIIDARNNNVYTAEYIWDGGLCEKSKADVMTIEECIERSAKNDKCVFVGDGIYSHRDKIAEKLGDRTSFGIAANIQQRASSIASAALYKVLRNETMRYNEMVPFYIRKSQAEQQLEEKLNKQN